MSEPSARMPVLTYLPGPWLAVVSDDLALLLDVTPNHPVLGACWNAAARGIGVDGVLAALSQAGGIENFALVGATSDGGTRVVVAGSGRAEVSGEQPSLLIATDGPRDERLPGRLAVRLAGPDAAASGALPVVKAIVSAAAVGRGVNAAAPPAAPAPPAPSAPPPPPPASNDTMPPSNYDSGLIESLPWRTPPTFDTGEAPDQPPAPEPPPAAAPASSWGAAPETNAVNPWTGYPPPGPPSGAPQGHPQGPPQGAPPAPPQGPPEQQLPPLSSPPAVPPSPFEPPPAPESPFGPPPQAPLPSPPMSSPPRDVPPDPPAGPPSDNPWAPRASTPDGAPAEPSAATPEPEEEPAPPAESGGAPMVHAFACPQQHLNPPYAGRCRLCDEAIPPQEGFLALRPALGVLRLSTGDTVPLDRDVVLGRSPFHADEDSALRPHLVQLSSPGNDISRSHLRVSLENWFVQVTDLDSTNGTVVTLPDQAPVRLRPHDPFTILPGTVVNIADEVTLRYEPV